MCMQGSDLSDWDVDCPSWSEQECAGERYWGGKGQCGRGHTMRKVIDMSGNSSPINFRVQMRVFTVESWDNEVYVVEVRPVNGGGAFIT